ncbi:hypothetical protein [Microbulbifer sp. SSSA005]|uniref:hypothetical protein n=1 Tax=Microbulbifer sp. SSSA005 TaxID=3243378 RepID=UPI004039751C
MIALSNLFLVNFAWSDWPFLAEEIISIELHKKLNSGQYNLFECDSSNSTGKLIVKANSHRKHYSFCIERKRKERKATLSITKESYEICLWQETGHCFPDGMCESIAILSDCAVVSLSKVNELIAKID